MNLLTNSSFLFLCFIFSSNLIGAQVPEHFRTHAHFQEGKNVCSENVVGARANIYCKGRILEAVMAMHLYNDSKTYVDKPLKAQPEIVIQAFEARFPNDENITREALTQFIDEYFKLEGQEMKECIPTDWKEKPVKLASINDTRLRDFAYQVNDIWKILCRQFNKDVFDQESSNSMIPVPNQFIIPGGRFREWYYWDSLWIVKGLLASEMYQTAKNVLSNFVYVVGKIGFIPNGGRIYYLARSQPPMLIPMFYEYLEATGDFEFVKKNLHILEKEFAFWDKQRTINVTVNNVTLTMYQYRAESNVPRPEMFREDVELTEKITDWKDKSQVWLDLATAAESGHDFSSRWMRDDSNLSTIETTQIIPVDLNAFLCRNMEILAHFYSLIPGAEQNENFYRSKHTQFKRDFQKLFYVDSSDGWYDYNLREKKNNIEYYTSNAVPIFARCYDSLDRLKVERVYQKMERFGAFNHSNGIPTSMHKSGQQWDLPNAWPPMGHMIIDGLRRSDSAKMQEQAYELAKKMVRTNYRMYYKHGNKMYEKYAVDGLDKGYGGEYETPVGFGWTNGVVLDLLTKYGSRFNLTEMLDELPETKSKHPGTPFFKLTIRTDVLILIVVLFIFILHCHWIGFFRYWRQPTTNTF